MNMREFVKIKCPTCENKNTQLCEIVYNVNGEAQCAFFKENKRMKLDKIDKEGFHFSKISGDKNV